MSKSSVSERLIKGKLNIKEIALTKKIGINPFGAL